MYVCCVLMIFFLLSLLQVSKEELAKLVQGFEKQDILQSSGVTLAGTRYIYLSGTERVIRAKLNKVGVHCMKTGQGTNKNAFLFFSSTIIFNNISKFGKKFPKSIHFWCAQTLYVYYYYYMYL